MIIRGPRPSLVRNESDSFSQVMDRDCHGELLSFQHDGTKP
jgi:hypothetical protein